MKPTSPSTSNTKPTPTPNFAPRTSHVDNQQRQQEKANSQSLNHTEPQGSDAGKDNAKSAPITDR